MRINDLLSKKVNVFAKNLAVYFNIVLEELKKGDVIHFNARQIFISKSADESEIPILSNSRPITIQSSVFKFLEYIIYKRIKNNQDIKPVNPA
jgi:hypothetical protein